VEVLQSRGRAKLWSADRSSTSLLPPGSVRGRGWVTAPSTATAACRDTAEVKT
jgi:hypothetical protein